jgi:hypothetical protein
MPELPVFYRNRNAAYNNLVPSHNADIIVSILYITAWYLAELFTLLLISFTIDLALGLCLAACLGGWREKDGIGSALLSILLPALLGDVIMMASLVYCWDPPELAWKMAAVFTVVMPVLVVVSFYARQQITRRLAS